MANGRQARKPARKLSGAAPSPGSTEPRLQSERPRRCVRLDDVWPRPSRLRGTVFGGWAAVTPSLIDDERDGRTLGVVRVVVELDQERFGARRSDHRNWHERGEQVSGDRWGRGKGPKLSWKNATRPFRPQFAPTSEAMNLAIATATRVLRSTTRGDCPRRASGPYLAVVAPCDRPIVLFGVAKTQ